MRRIPAVEIGFADSWKRTLPGDRAGGRGCAILRHWPAKWERLESVEADLFVSSSNRHPL